MLMWRSLNGVPLFAVPVDLLFVSARLKALRAVGNMHNGNSIKLLTGKDNNFSR